MIVISDTTALTNLLKIDRVVLLKDVFGEILIPKAVEEELRKVEHHEKFLASCNWIRVAEPENRLEVTLLLAVLGRGEAEAIILAKERQADFLIMDELKGRNKAKSYGLKIIGLLGILIEAKRTGKNRTCAA